MLKVFNNKSTIRNFTFLLNSSKSKKQKINNFLSIPLRRNFGTKNTKNLPIIRQTYK